MENQNKYIENITFETPNKLFFNIKRSKNITISLVNSLRRIMLSDIETLAIDIAQFKEYNSLIPDEYFAHRLGLIPIRRKNKYITNAKLELKLEFDINKADYKGIQNVYSNSLIPLTSDIEIVDKDILLTKFIKGNYMNIICEAITGTGSIHAKWDPCCGTSYEYNDQKFNVVIDTNGTLTADEVFNESINILINKLENIETSL